MCNKFFIFAFTVDVLVTCTSDRGRTGVKHQIIVGMISPQNHTFIILREPTPISNGSI